MCCVKNKAIAVVLGGHVNGYNIIRELSSIRIDIALVYDKPCLASFSNKVSKSYKIEINSANILKTLKYLHKKYEKIILFPTDDLQLDLILEIETDIIKYCHIPFSKQHYIKYSSKIAQLKLAQELGIPVPKSVHLKNKNDIRKLTGISLPIIIKPIVRLDLRGNTFRNLVIKSEEDLKIKIPNIQKLLLENNEFIVQEVIPGDDDNIFSYTCSKVGNEIINYWIGQKYSQFPNKYGVFSSASIVDNQVVEKQGLALCAAIDHNGILQPEFRFDPRDGKYKLMEINFRSMMWHGVGYQAGVTLHRDIVNQYVPEIMPIYRQKLNSDFIYVLFLHEFGNLILRYKYRKKFFALFKLWAQIRFAILDRSDIKPFIFSLYLLLKVLVKCTFERLKYGKID